MAIKTRFFGKKIKGEVLENLVSALGKNPKELHQSSVKKNEPWYVESVRGRCNLSPVKQGIDVDLYIFKIECVIRGGLGPHIRYFDHLQGRINYKDASKTRINK